MREPDVDHISGSKTTMFFSSSFDLSAVGIHSIALLPPSGKYIALLDPYIHFSRPERVRNLKTSFIPPSSKCHCHPPFPVSSRVSLTILPAY